MMPPSILLKIKWFPLPSPHPRKKKKKNGVFPGPLGCWNKKHGGGDDLQWIIARKKTET